MYGFAYMDGMSKEILEPFYNDNNESFLRSVRPDVSARLQLFLGMTATYTSVSMETSRYALDILCKRIRKSDYFFPQVSNLQILIQLSPLYLCIVLLCHTILRLIILSGYF